MASICWTQSTVVAGMKRQVGSGVGYIAFNLPGVAFVNFCFLGLSIYMSVVPLVFLDDQER